MQEILEQIIDYLKGIWIKRRYIMISTWLICPAAWYMVAQLPDVYKSQAKVYVNTQSLLRPLLRGLTVETNPDSQIRLMVRTLLSRANLERISRMTDLDIQANNNEEYEEIIQNLKKTLKISAAGRVNIFTLSVTDKNPQMAKNIVQSALTVFMENTLGETRNDADAAQKFIDTQIKEYEKRLSVSEARLTVFKQKYSGILPDQSGGFYAQLNSAKEQLKSINLELLETKTRLSSAKEQLSINAQAITNVDSKITNNSSIKTTFDNRIAYLETALDSLLLKYTDKHPDVIEVNKRLDLLNKKRNQEIEKYLAASSEGDSNKAPINQSPVMQEVQIQVNQLENQVASLNVRAQNYQERVKDLESKIHILPEIEAELVALNRGYSITKQKYEKLLGRKETALLAQQADQTTNRIQFRVMDPPRAETKPSGPPRTLYFLGVLVLGVGAGIGISLGMSQLIPIVTSGSQVSKATGIPIFGIVSANENLGLHSWQKKKTIIFILSNIILFGVLIMFISYFLFPNLIQTPLKRLF
ncbi:MAG: chain length determinant family protein [Alteromonadaceae bacterium]|nr:chain length determinant family protein [Alteromonadaceae bacterium]